MYCYKLYLIEPEIAAYAAQCNYLCKCVLQLGYAGSATTVANAINISISGNNCETVFSNLLYCCCYIYYGYIHNWIHLYVWFTIRRVMPVRKIFFSFNFTLWECLNISTWWKRVYLSKCSSDWQYSCTSRRDHLLLALPWPAVDLRAQSSTIKNIN